MCVCEQLLRLVVERDATSTAAGIEWNSSWDAEPHAEQTFDQCEFNFQTDLGSSELTCDQTVSSPSGEGDGTERQWVCTERCQVPSEVLDAPRESAWWGKSGTGGSLRVKSGTTQARQVGGASCVIQFALQDEEILLS